MKAGFLVCLLIVVNAASGQQSVVISQKANSNEPSIAVHRLNPAWITAASNLNAIYYSRDTGHTWNSYALTSPYGFYGDPVLHATFDGSIYVTHLSKTKGKQWGAWFDRIVVQRSDDGGKTFNDGAAVGYNGNRTQDKPWLASDEYSEKYKGNLYLTWTEFDQYGSASETDRSRIRFSRSSDKGATWSDPVTISDATGDCLDGDNTVEGATIATDENGTIYCVWAVDSKIFMDLSTDGGRTWGTDRVIGLQPGGWSRTVKGLNRGNGLPFITSDVSDGSRKATLYVTWTLDQGPVSRVTVISSDDHGDTWSDLQFPRFSPGKQLFSNIAGDPQGRTAYIIYSNVLEAGNEHFMQHFLIDYSAMASGGTEGQPVSEEASRLSPIFALPGRDVFFGDYQDLDIAHGHIYTVFTTTATDGRLQIRFLMIDENRFGTAGPETVHYSGDRVVWSCQDTVLFVAMDHIDEVRITIRNKNRRVLPGRSSTWRHNIQKPHEPVFFIQEEITHRYTRVRVRYSYIDPATNERIKVKRKTKFVRKESDADIN